MATMLVDTTQDDDGGVSFVATGEFGTLVTNDDGGPDATNAGAAFIGAKGFDSLH